jgi:hypothetical protein
MNTSFRPKMLTLAFTAAMAFMVTACGSKFTGTYSLNQQGAQFSSMQGCSLINLSMNESSGQLSGWGQNQCFQEQISGSSSGGQANVTLTVMPASSGMNSGMNNGMNNGFNNGFNNFGYQGYGSSGMCSYQGVLTISGNSVTGTLMPVSQTSGFGNCSGQVFITGTKN